MYFQIQDTKYSVCIDVEYFTTVAVTVYDTGRHREIQIVYNTGRKRPCGGLFLTAHTVLDGRASLSHRDNYRRTCYRFFNFWPWGLTPGPKVTKRGDDLLSTYIYHPTKFQPDRANGVRDMRYQIFSVFGVDFWPLKVIQGQIRRCQSIAHGPYV